MTHHHPFLSYSFPFFRRHFSLLTDEHIILPCRRHSITTYSSMATQMGHIFTHNTKATWRCSAKKILKRITDCQYSFFFFFFYNLPSEVPLQSPRAKAQQWWQTSPGALLSAEAVVVAFHSCQGRCASPSTGKAK